MLNLQVYHNSHDSYFRRPFGAVPCGTTIRLRVEIRSKIPVALCQLRVWEKGTVERLLTMGLEKSEREERRHRQVFEMKYRVPEEPGLVWYYFCLTLGEQVFYYGNNPENLGGEGCLVDAQPPGYQITVYRPCPVPPWFRHGVMYQIFVDRFYCSKEAFPPRGTGLSPGGLLHLDWSDTPFYLRGEDGGIKRWTFFGGNLAGIMEKLDYLQELGISILYLNPIFQARSSHKYDTGDYLTIDPLYGDEAIFRELVTQAQERGISIILDGVFSHTGSDSIYFNKEGTYPGLGAFQSPGSH
ncbi:MAG TPA: 4-alpha-glucanotransferase, partial [Clostridia bacterium]|nr:4-alpha-glucanotransferase [Clostridia bacterium]